jgi:hypothetical protein
MRKNKSLLKSLEVIADHETQQWIKDKVYEKNPHWKALGIEGECYVSNNVIRLLEYAKDDKPPNLRKFIIYELNNPLVRSIKEKRREIQEKSRGISKEDLDWMEQKLAHSKDQGQMSKLELEDFLLFRLSHIVYCIQKDKPRDVRAYVENELKKEAYDHQLGKLMLDFGNIKFGDVKACEDATKKLDTLLKKAEKDFTGFTNARSLMINELKGDLLALRTNGEMGSTRMLMRYKELNKKDTKDK